MFEHLIAGFVDGHLPHQPPLLLFRRDHGDDHRRPARRRAGGRDGHARSLHLRHESHHRHHHAGRHLLRGHVRRFDHLHPGEPSRGILLGHDLPGRLPDGPERQGRRGPGDIGHRLLHRRDPERARPDAAGAPAGRLCHPLRPAGVFLP